MTILLIIVAIIFIISLAYDMYCDIFNEKINNSKLTSFSGKLLLILLIIYFIIQKL